MILKQLSSELPERYNYEISVDIFNFYFGFGLCQFDLQTAVGFKKEINYN